MERSDRDPTTWDADEFEDNYDDELSPLDEDGLGSPAALQDRADADES